MPPLPGVMTILTPSQPVLKSLNSTASTTMTTSSVTTTTMEMASSNNYANNMTSSDHIEPPTFMNSNHTKYPAMELPLPSNNNNNNVSSVETVNPTANSTANEIETDAAVISQSSKTSSTTNGDECSSSTNDQSENSDIVSTTSSNNCDSKNNENVESVDSSSLLGAENSDSDFNSSSIFGRPRKILLQNVNDNITCSICKGYLIDATTIVECLHSFCHSCIMNYLRKDQYCPRCEMMINTTKHNNIKLDTTLQAIVYKLVPGLYEKELLRKRAFYSSRPEEAKLATPEQRGDDTEHLIFGPTDNMSLSLEYADIEELPENDSHELHKPKYLQCPANFTVAHLKKFVFGKFGIDQHRFTIDIMYKVKTILLADHYKMMDIAYIYTWKRDAPMKFFFRVKEVERPLRRRNDSRVIRSNSENGSEMICSESLANPVDDTEIKSEDDYVKIETTPEIQDHPKIKVESNGLPVSEELPPPIDVKIKEEQENEFNLPKLTADKSPTLTQLANKMSQDVLLLKRTTEKLSPVPRFEKSSAKQDRSSPAEQRTEKSKLSLSGKCKKDEDTPKIKSSSKSSRTPKHSPSYGEPDDRKVENIKLKIDLSKEGSVTIINMSSPDSTKKEIVKPLKPEKEWKIKVKKDKDLKANGFGDKSKSPTDERTVPPIRIELSKPHSPSSGKSKAELDEETKKSEFLNSFHLAPIKSLTSPEKQDKHKSPVSPPKSPLIPAFTIRKPSMPPPLPPMKLSASSKRKSKEPVKTIAKKSRLDFPMPKSLPPITALPSKPTSQIKVRTNLTAETKPDAPGISFKLAPFPIGAGETSTDLKTSPEVKKEEKTRNLEDQKLMPAPPPLKMIDIFRRNGVKGAAKPPKPKQTAKSTKSASNGGFLRPMVTTNMANPKVPIVSNVMGNRTPIARRYPPILPKSPRINPFASLAGEVNNLLQNNSTEIKPIQNGDGKEIKVYGPSTTAPTTSSPPNPPVSAVTQSMPSLHPLPVATAAVAAANQRPMPKPSTSNYLNYALLNSSKSKMGDVAMGCRTPIYTPNSPIYSPNSPQYMPNYNIPIQPTYKYTKTQSNANNILQNILGTNQMSNLFPAPPTKKPEQLGNNNNNNNTKMEANDAVAGSQGKKSPEPDKQTPVQSLLNSCNINIPSSLSITITNENDDANVSKSMNNKLSNPVNNYIEIVKLPETPAVEHPKITTPPPPPPSPSNGSDSKSTKAQRMSPTMAKATNSPKMSPPPTPPAIKLSPKSQLKRKSPLQFDIDKKASSPSPSPSSSPQSPLSKSLKKTPSPEKKPSSTEKSTKKSSAEKRSSSDSNKSTKDKSDISPIPTKKYRPILPRSRTPPPNPASLPPVVPNLLTKFAGKQLTVKSQTGKKPPAAKTANRGAAANSAAARKTKESLIDYSAPRKAITPPSNMSLLPGTIASQSAAAISPDFVAFLAQQQLQLQQQQQHQQQQGNQSPCNPVTNGTNFLPHLAAAAAFNPTVSFDIQRAFFMEHLARMQKAGNEALEKYMQQLKNNNTTCAKSPAGSPGSTTGGQQSLSTSPVNNVKNSA